MRALPDRYKTVGRRDFQAALEHLLETEFKLVGSHRVIRLISEAVMELHREFYPESRHLEPIEVQRIGEDKYTIFYKLAFRTGRFNPCANSIWLRLSFPSLNLGMEIRSTKVPSLPELRSVNFVESV